MYEIDQSQALKHKAMPLHSRLFFRLTHKDVQYKMMINDIKLKEAANPHITGT